MSKIADAIVKSISTYRNRRDQKWSAKTSCTHTHARARARAASEKCQTKFPFHCDEDTIVFNSFAFCWPLFVSLFLLARSVSLCSRSVKICTIFFIIYALALVKLKTNPTWCSTMFCALTTHSYTATHHSKTASPIRSSHEQITVLHTSNDDLTRFAR